MKKNFYLFLLTFIFLGVFITIHYGLADTPPPRVECVLHNQQGGLFNGVGNTASYYQYYDSPQYPIYAGDPGSYVYDFDVSNMVSWAQSLGMYIYYSYPNGSQIWLTLFPALSYFSLPSAWVGYNGGGVMTFNGWNSKVSVVDNSTCPYVLAYPRYQLFTAYDSSSGNQISTDKSYDGTPTNWRGVDFTIPAGSSAPLNFSIKNTFSSSILNKCGWVNSGSCKKTSYNPSPWVPFVSNAQALWQTQAANLQIIHASTNLPAGVGAPPDLRVPVPYKINTGWGNIGYSAPQSIQLSPNASQSIGATISVNSNAAPGTYTYMMTVFNPATNPVNSDGDVGTTYFIPTSIPIRVNVYQPSNYGVSCSVLPGLTIPGADVVFTGQVNGNIVNTLISYSWSKGCDVQTDSPDSSVSSGNSYFSSPPKDFSSDCIMRNVGGDVLSDPPTVTVTDPHGYKSSVTCPAPNVLTEAQIANLPTPKISVSGGPIFKGPIFKVSTTNSATVNLHVADALPGNMISFLPKFVDSTDRASALTINPLTNLISGGNPLIQFLNTINKGGTITKMYFTDPLDGTYSASTQVGCKDVGVWRLSAKVAGKESKDAVFAVVPDPSKVNACSAGGGGGGQKR